MLAPAKTKKKRPSMTNLLEGVNLKTWSVPQKYEDKTNILVRFGLFSTPNYCEVSQWSSVGVEDNFFPH